MNELNEFINKISSQTDISYDRLPDIDLYMDQVIEYLTKQCSTDTGNDKISGAMINNYTTPECKLIIFEGDDVIRTSSVDEEKDNLGGIGDYWE